MNDTMLFSPSPENGSAQDQHAQMPDLAAICGQEHVKRALEVAACGGHGLALTGSPGMGKTLLSRAISLLLPPLSDEEEQTRRAAFAAAHRPMPPALQSDTRLVVIPSPLITPQQLLGQGTDEQPGALLFARSGVLLLDRLDLFAPDLLHSLHASCDRPEWMGTQLVVTLQPCPCGWLGDPARECLCSAEEVTRHQLRLRPLIERQPMCIEVPRVSDEQMADQRSRETSAQVRARVLAGVAFAQARSRRDGTARTALLDAQATQRFCRPDASGEKLLNVAIRQLHLSVRATHQVLRVARTIADLAQSQTIQASHLAEAISYRPR
jgi:magnesium chelatase family protein